MRLENWQICSEVCMETQNYDLVSTVFPVKGGKWAKTDRTLVKAFEPSPGVRDSSMHTEIGDSE
jgi:hypothetical protein